MPHLIGVLYNGHVMRILRLGIYGALGTNPKILLSLPLNPSGKARHVSEEARGGEALCRQLTSLWFLCFLSFLLPNFIFWLAPHDPSILDHAVYTCIAELSCEPEDSSISGVRGWQIASGKTQGPVEKP